MIPGKSQLLNVPQVPHLKRLSIRMTLGGLDDVVQVEA